MKVLFDECVPKRLLRFFGEYNCQTVRQAGLAGKKNGELLRLAEGLDTDVLLTVDQNFPYQQRIEGRHIALLILCAESNRLDDLLPLVPSCLDALKRIKQSEVIRISS